MTGIGTVRVICPMLPRRVRDPYVKMQPVLDDLAFGNALEEQSRAHT
jgi:hypothetical protein